MKTRNRLAGAAALSLGLAVALGAPALANNGGHGNKPVKGVCSGSSSLKLATSNHGKGIKVTAKIKTGVAGEAWDWSISDNGTTVAADQSTTNKNDKLVVRQQISKQDGANTIDFAATDTVTGETCTAEAVVGG